jgi:hypothetical protein
MVKRYPIKKFALKVKMRCDYYPDTHRRCTNRATIIKVSSEDEGKTVYAYCADCFRDYQVRQRERRKMERE